MFSNNSVQIVHTHLPLLPSIIIWHWLKGGDALQLGGCTVCSNHWVIIAVCFHIYDKVTFELTS